MSLIEEAFRQVLAFCETEEVQKEIKIGLRAFERKQLYQRMEKLSVKLYKCSRDVGDGYGYITCSKEPLLKENGAKESPLTQDHSKTTEAPKTPKITKKLIQLFVETSNIPIPSNSPQSLDYYLEVLDPYYDTKAKWKSFLETPDICNLQQEMKQVIVKISKEAKESKSLESFRAQKVTVAEATLSDPMVKSFEPYAGHTLLSIDIVSANFTISRMAAPDFFHDEPTFYQFISRYTDCEWLRNSKIFREKLFGELKLVHAFKKFYPLYLEKAKKVAATFGLQPFGSNGDELLFDVPPSFSSELLSTQLESEYPGMFRVKTFYLRAIGEGKRIGFAKEHTDGKVQFFTVPRKFLLQYLKAYEGKPCEEADLLFVDDGMEATYKTPLVLPVDRTCSTDAVSG